MSQAKDSNDIRVQFDDEADRPRRLCSACGKDLGDFGKRYACSHVECAQHAKPVCVDCTVKTHYDRREAEYKDPLWLRVPNWVYSLLISLAIGFALWGLIRLLGWRINWLFGFGFLPFGLAFGKGLPYILYSWLSDAATGLDGIELTPGHHEQSPKSPYSRAPLRCCKACGYETREAS